MGSIPFTRSMSKVVKLKPAVFPWGTPPFLLMEGSR